MRVGNEAIMRANERVRSVEIIREATEFPMHRLLIGAVFGYINGVAKSTQAAKVFE
jgi:hypothetical protein